MTTQTITLNRIISELKELNEFDGETVEYLIETIGFSEYMLRALMMKQKIKDVQYHYEERVEYEKDSYKLKLNNMENFTAVLNCEKKIIIIKFNDELFTLDLTLGDLGDSWNNIRDNNNLIWNTNFNWEDGEDDSQPCFCIYGTELDENAKLTIDMEDEIIIDIIEIIGTKEDYFKTHTEVRNSLKDFWQDVYNANLNK